MTVRFLLDIAMMAWMLEMCSSPHAVARPTKQICWDGCSIAASRPSDWRDPVDMDRDVLLGIWMGWFGWLAFPNLFTGRWFVVLASGSGIVALFFLLLFLFSGGFVVLLLHRFVVGRSVLRLFGKFGGEVFAQFVGDPHAHGPWMPGATLNVLNSASSNRMHDVRWRRWFCP